MIMFISPSSIPGLIHSYPHRGHQLLFLPYSPSPSVCKGACSSCHIHSLKESWPTVPLSRDALYINICARAWRPQLDEDVPSRPITSNVSSAREGQKIKRTYTAGLNLTLTLVLRCGIAKRACGRIVSCVASPDTLFASRMASSLAFDEVDASGSAEESLS